MNPSIDIQYSPIKTLSAQLANQIAAGEVVERPASVVKELVENSLDAGATAIHVEIDQGGQKRILIRDNGKGIVKDELTLALSRHATSKISNIDDLENITSMGFRGEALASISSVSRLTLTSKPHQQSEAWQARTEGQQMAVEISPAAHPDGTSIEVLDLFFNTPARRKFLRTGKTEFQHIEQILKRLALTRHDVQFTLVHNNKTVFKYPITSQLTQRIEQVCGRTMLDKTVSVDYEFEGVRLHGCCSELGFGASTRDYQYTFVNGRMMRDKLLSHALRQVFEETLPPQTFPTYVLFLTLAPDQLDVNVHPAKHEVRFHQARKIHDIVFKAASEALGSTTDLADNASKQELSHDYIRPLQSSTQSISNSAHTISSEQSPTTSETSAPYSVSQNVGSKESSGYKSSYTAQSHMPKRPAQKELNATHQFYQSVHQQTAQTSTNTEPEPHNSEYLIVSSNLVFAQHDELVVLPIQRLLAAYLQVQLEGSTTAQPLLMPVSLNLNSDIPNAQVKAFIATLEKLFLIVDFRSNKLILKQVPSNWRQLPWVSLFPALLASTLFEKQYELKQSILTQALSSAWLSLIEPISSHNIATWLQELGPINSQHLIQNEGTALNVEQLMLSAKQKEMDVD